MQYSVMVQIVNSSFFLFLRNSVFRYSLNRQLVTKINSILSNKLMKNCGCFWPFGGKSSLNYQEIKGKSLQQSFNLLKNNQLQGTPLENVQKKTRFTLIKNDQKKTLTVQTGNDKKGNERTIWVQMQPSQKYKLSQNCKLKIGDIQICIVSISDKRQKKSEQKYKNIENICRKCQKNNQSKNNPLINPCECKFQNYLIHLQCFRKQYMKKVKVSRTQNMIEFKTKNIICQFCETLIPFSVKHNQKQLVLIDSQILDSSIGQDLTQDELSNLLESGITKYQITQFQSTLQVNVKIESPRIRQDQFQLKILKLRPFKEIMLGKNKEQCEFLMQEQFLSDIHLIFYSFQDQAFVMLEPSNTPTFIRMLPEQKYYFETKKGIILGLQNFHILYLKQPENSFFNFHPKNESYKLEYTKLE